MLKVERIRQLRVKRGLTQAQAALEAGLSSKQHWSQIETGRDTGITLATLRKIAKALGCRAKDLIDE